MEDDTPKVELHRHLDGSVRLETVLDLARVHGLDLGDDLAKRLKIKAPMESLEAVLDCFWTTQKVLCGYEAVKRVAFENVEDCFRDGVKLAELRFAPAFIAKGKDLPHEDIVSAVIDGVRDGMRAYDIQVGLIHIAARTLDFRENEKALDATLSLLKGKGAGLLVGFDLADTEAMEDIPRFIPMVEKARAHGLGITVHTGENTDAEHLLKSLDCYGMSRVGHGIKAWGREAALERLIDSDVLLEVCPTSNWLTRSVDALEGHPLPLLHRRGVPVCLNSDDPHIMDIDLRHEYRVARDLLGMSAVELLAMNRRALDHSFLPKAVVAGVRRRHFSA